MKFRPRTDSHDLKHKMKKVREFLDAGNRVKLIVSFRGREMAHLDKGMDLLTNLLREVEGEYRMVQSGRQDGRQYSVTIGPR